MTSEAAGLPEASKEPHLQIGHSGVDETLGRIARLQTDRSYRDSAEAYFIEGVRNVVAAVGAGVRPALVLMSDVLLTSSAARAAVRGLRHEGVPIIEVSPEQFRSISKLERASGVGAILSQSARAIHQVKARPNQCWIALRNVRSPGNLGSLIRTSAAVGSAGFILLGPAVDPYDPLVVRASMGSLFHQTFVRTSGQALHHWVTRHRLEVVGVSADGTDDYDRCRYRRPAVLMLGEERRGLDAEQRRLCGRFVRIPMVQGIDSLNLAVAGSLMLYQVARERTRRRR